MNFSFEDGKILFELRTNYDVYEYESSESHYVERKLFTFSILQLKLLD